MAVQRTSADQERGAPILAGVRRMILAALESALSSLLARLFKFISAVKHLSYKGFWKSERMRLALALRSPRGGRLLIGGRRWNRSSGGVAHVWGQARRVLSDREEAPLLEPPQALVDLSAEHHSRGFLHLLINSASRDTVEGRVREQVYTSRSCRRSRSVPTQTNSDGNEQTGSWGSSPWRADGASSPSACCGGTCSPPLCPREARSPTWWRTAARTHHQEQVENAPSHTHT